MEISYDEFARLDIRVARVVSAEPIPGKSKIIKGTVDLGDQKRQVIIGGAEHYTPDSMIGRTVIVVANLAPRSIAGVTSEAMLLAADVGDVPFWLTVDDAVRPGARVR